MAITANHLRHAAARAKDAAAFAQDDLNAADGKMGDGDTGVMLRRLFEAVAAAIPDQETDIGNVFQACAKACAGGRTCRTGRCDLDSPFQRLFRFCGSTELTERGSKPTIRQRVFRM